MRGKSTLFNFITEANVYAADQLFATLDPTLKTFTNSAMLVRRFLRISAWFLFANFPMI
ncbi:MAG: GTPase [Haemophilus parainfluenzae]